MRVLGIAGSPRQGGNTDCLLAEVMRGAASRGAEIKTLRICQMNIAPCRHCDGCLTTGECTIEDDMQSIYKELAAADRIVLASPLYFMGVTAQLTKKGAFYLRRRAQGRRSFPTGDGYDKSLLCQSGYRIRRRAAICRYGRQRSRFQPPGRPQAGIPRRAEAGGLSRCFAAAGKDGNQG